MLGRLGVKKLLEMWRGSVEDCQEKMLVTLTKIAKARERRHKDGEGVADSALSDSQHVSFRISGEIHRGCYKSD